MQSRSDLKVGIEMRVMAGALTGVGNYSLNLLEALVSDYAYLQYAGFGLLSWKAVDAAALKRIEAAKSSRAETKGFAADRIDSLRTMVRKRLSQSDLALTLYRMQFSRTVKRQSFDLFHAFNFLPFADPGVVTLPVIYDLSFVRYPDAHPPERLKRLSGLPALLDRAPLVQTISQFSRNEIVSRLWLSKRTYFCGAARCEQDLPTAWRGGRPRRAQRVWDLDGQLPSCCRNARTPEKSANADNGICGASQGREERCSAGHRRRRGLGRIGPPNRDIGAT